METLYTLLLLGIPAFCICLVGFVAYKVVASRRAGHYQDAPTIHKEEAYSYKAPKLQHKDPHEGKIVVPRPLNRTQRRLLKKDAKKWAKGKGLKGDQANAIAEATVRGVVVDPVTYQQRQRGLVK